MNIKTKRYVRLIMYPNDMYIPKMRTWSELWWVLVRLNIVRLHPSHLVLLHRQYGFSGRGANLGNVANYFTLIQQALWPEQNKVQDMSFWDILGT